MLILDLLERTRALLKTSDKWTQSAYARNEFGEPTLPYNPSATCWCLSGAIGAVIGSVATNDLYNISRVLQFDDECAMANWNDSHTYDEVIQRLDGAIARYKGLRKITQLGQEMGGYDAV